MHIAELYSCDQESRRVERLLVTVPPNVHEYHRQTNALRDRIRVVLKTCEIPSQRARTLSLILDTLKSGFECALHIDNLLDRLLIAILGFELIHVGPKLGISLLGQTCAASSSYKRETH